VWIWLLTVETFNTFYGSKVPRGPGLPVYLGYVRSHSGTRHL